MEKCVEKSVENSICFEILVFSDFQSPKNFFSTFSPPVFRRFSTSYSKIQNQKSLVLQRILRFPHFSPPLLLLLRQNTILLFYLSLCASRREKRIRHKILSKGYLYYENCIQQTSDHGCGCTSDVRCFRQGNPHRNRGYPH